MRKAYLLAAIAALGAQMASANVAELTEFSARQVSPDGKYVVSDADEGIVKVMDVASGDIIYEIGYNDNYSYVFLGYGYAVTETGCFVGEHESQPVIVDFINNGVVQLPYNEDIAYGGVAQAVTPDGQYISGVIANMGEGPSNLPVVWTRLDDGSYGMPEILPFPLDCMGLTPSRIEVYGITDNGSTVAGQIYDALNNSGQTLIWPFVVNKDSDGKWESLLVHPELINPEGITLPEKPGAQPSLPYPSEFLSEEEKAAYYEAIDEYWEGERDEYPNAVDFLTGDNLKAYNDALQIYTEWEEKDTLWCEAYLAIYESAPHFWWTTSMSPNGKYLTQFDGSINYYSGAEFGKSYIFDLEQGSYTMTSEPENFYALHALDNGTVLGYTVQFGGTWKGYILQPGSDKAISVLDWIASKSKSDAEWVEENLTHHVLNGFAGGEDLQEEEAVITGMPCADRNMNVMACAVQNCWDFEGSNLGQCLTYVYDYSSTVSVDALEMKESELIDVWTISGSLIKNGVNKSELQNLEKGIYVVKCRDRTYKYFAR